MYANSWKKSVSNETGLEYAGDILAFSRYLAYSGRGRMAARGSGSRKMRSAGVKRLKTAVFRLRRPLSLAFYERSWMNNGNPMRRAAGHGGKLEEGLERVLDREVSRLNEGGFSEEMKLLGYHKGVGGRRTRLRKGAFRGESPALIHRSPVPPDSSSSPFDVHAPVRTARSCDRAR